MQLVNEFVVPTPIDEAWAVLTDLPRIAPCAPGATLKVRELDADAHRIVLDAGGDGGGESDAVVTADLTADGDGTRVRVVTDLTPVVAESRWYDDFAACLRETVLARPAPAASDLADHDLVSGPYAPAVPPVQPAVSASNPLGATSTTLGLAPAGAYPTATGAAPGEVRATGRPTLSRLVPAAVVIVVIVVLLVWWLG